MGTLLLHILFVSVGAVIGGAAGWFLRSANPQKPLDPATADPHATVPKQEVEANLEHVDTLMSRLHQLTASVAADVGEHNSRVQAINEDLTNGGDVVSVIERLMKANEQMSSQLQAAEQRMQQQSSEIEAHCRDARTDALTKLANRRGFDDEIRRCIEANHTKGQTSSIMMIDVDHFKKFNDTYGHLAGDEVLRNVARVLRREVAPDEIVCRYGGEEFAIIYPAMNAKAAVPRAEKARAAIAREVIEFQGMDLRVTASGGVAELQNRESAEDFVKRADIALYACKENGRNCGYWHDGTDCHPMKGFEAPAEQAPAIRPEPAPVPTAPVAKAKEDSDTTNHQKKAKAAASTPATEPAAPRTVPATPAPSAVNVEPESPESEDDEEQVFKFCDETSAPKIQRRDRIVGFSDYGTFCRDVDRRLAEFQRDGGCASLLLIAVDDCQEISESYGAKALDMALRNAAQAVKANRREMDHAARCNDKVFALLLPNSGTTEAKSIAERIRSDISNNPLRFNEQDLSYSVSVGVTEFGVNDLRELVIQRANQSLEAAQTAGGNRTMIFTADGTVPLSVATKANPAEGVRG